MTEHFKELSTYRGSKSEVQVNLYEDPAAFYSKREIKKWIECPVLLSIKSNCVALCMPQQCLKCTVYMYLRSPPTFTGPIVCSAEPSDLLRTVALFDLSAWTVETATTISF